MSADVLTSDGVVAALIALALLVYLSYTLLRPERF